MQLPTKEQALAGLFALWQPQAPLEYVGINDAYGRVLAKDLYSLLTLPQVRASAADGVCVGSAMFAHGLPDTTDWRYGVDYARADTGDDFDDAFDTVIRIEDVILTANKLTLSPDLVFTPGMNIRASGSLIKSGAPLLSADLPLRATDVAALAMGGQTSIPVYRRPRVAFIPTGNELIAAGKQPQRGENIDTNSIMAGLLLQEMGAEPLLYPIIPDNQERLSQALHQALAEADIVVLNGGSSKGGEDYNARLLENLGQLLCHGVAAGPGKPLAIAIIDQKPVINLPGPAIAALHGLEWCVRAVVERWLKQPPLQRPLIKGVLTQPLSSAASMSFQCLLHIGRAIDGHFMLTPVDFRRNSPAACLTANGLYFSPQGIGDQPAGTILEVQLLRNAEYIETEQNS